MEKLLIELKGIQQNRGDFLDDFRETIQNFLPESMDRQKKLQLDVLFREIIKNIYDHANGIGVFEIEKREKELSFSIHSPGLPCDFHTKRKEESEKKGNGINCGIGLFLIESILHDFMKTYSIDTTAGFRYTGVMMY